MPKKVQKKIPIHPQNPDGKFIKKKNRKAEEVFDDMEVSSDIRKNKFAAAYLDPMSSTYGNGLQSALLAGYSPNHAKQLIYTKPKWLKVFVGKLNILGDLERNFKNHINLNPLVPAMGAFGPILDKKTKKPIMVESNSRLKLRQEITMFGLEKLHPDFRKDKKEGGNSLVEIKNIIIIAPDGKSIPYNQAPAETIRSLPETS